jgi:hypothetical protein
MREPSGDHRWFAAPNSPEVMRFGFDGSAAPMGIPIVQRCVGRSRST